MTLLFDDLNHEYALNGVVLPSVTQIIDFEIGSIYETVPENQWEAIEIAGKFGKAVHTGIKLALLGTLDRKTVDPAIKPCIDSALAFIDIMGVKVDKTRIEKPMASKKYGFAGTPDLIGTIKDRKVIVDWKTTTTVDIERIKLQLAGYEILEEENYGFKEVPLKFGVQLHLSHGWRPYSFIQTSRREFLTILKKYKEIEL